MTGPDAAVATVGGDPGEALASFGGDPAERGTVTIVGGGPGDPGLLTLRAATVLATCDVVAYDRLSPPEALALVPARAERICVGRRSGEAARTRRSVEALLVQRARAGLAVVRLKGGDPFVFGRGGEEAAACRAAGVRCEVVAGVTSAVAAPAAAGIPVTHRGVSAGFAVVTAHEDPAKPAESVDYAALARFPGTLVFLMGVAHTRRLASALLAHGMRPDTPAALVRWGTTARQETLQATLATVADEVERRGFAAPAVTVVGDVVELGSYLPSRAERALHGVRVLVPRTLERPSRLAARIRALGGDPVEVAVARTLPGDDATVAAAVRRLRAGGYAALALTSPHAVDVLGDALADEGLDARALAGVHVLAAGSGACRRLRQRMAIRADVAQPSASALAEALAPGRGRVLALAQDRGDRALLAGLQRRGYEPEVVSAYRTARVERLPAAVVDALADKGAYGIPLVALASSSSARHLGGLLDGRPTVARTVSIGPATSAAARAAGLDVHAEAAPADLDGLLEALVKAAADRPAATAGARRSPEDG